MSTYCWQHTHQTKRWFFPNVHSVGLPGAAEGQAACYVSLRGKNLESCSGSIFTLKVTVE